MPVWLRKSIKETYMKIKKGDTIIVMVGKDKGKKGKVDRIFPKSHTLVVAGINMVKRHMKKRDEKNPGGIIDQVRPIDASKVALVCPSCGKPTRVGYLVVKGLPRGKAGEKERICKRCRKRIA